MKGGEKLESKKVRYEYIDVLKFLGIFAIYLGHITSPSGSVYKFVFLYHVPLFFFVSGWMDMNKEMIFKSKNEKNYLSKQYISSIVYDIKTLIIPWLFFAIFSIIVNILNYGFEKERVIYLL